MRFIPTQVGNTPWSVTAGAVKTVHPHTSGEYGGFIRSRDGISGSSPHKWGILRIIFRYSFETGSSPHKWGIQLDGGTADVSQRFIPTQVGNTWAVMVRTVALPVHPHTSGEYTFSKSTVIFGYGSSPHKWGILDGNGIWVQCVRFIPTQVGNTSASRRCRWRRAVHPHTSGEYVVHFLYINDGVGSSPHKWGILQQRLN